MCLIFLYDAINTRINATCGLGSTHALKFMFLYKMFVSFHMFTNVTVYQQLANSFEESSSLKARSSSSRQEISHCL